MSAVPLHACGGSACAICNPETGEERRARGMALAEHGGSAVLGERAEWNARWDRWIVGFARTRGRFTTDDVRTALRDNPPPSERMWGPAYKRAMNAGVIRHVGYVKATTATRNAGIASEYEWVGR